MEEGPYDILENDVQTEIIEAQPMKKQTIISILLERRRYWDVLALNISPLTTPLR